MNKNRRQKTVGNYLVVVLPPIVIGLFIGLLVEQHLGWLGPTAAAGLLLGITTAVLSITADQQRIKKMVWWLHTVFGFAVASYSTLQPFLTNKAWNIWFGIVPGLAVALTVIALSLIVLGAKDLSKQKTVSTTAAQPGRERENPAVTERAQVNLFTPRARETQGIDVTRTLENIGHGARADLLAAANESRKLDLEEIKLIRSLGEPQKWSNATRTIVARRFGEELLQELTAQKENIGNSREGKPHPEPIITGWGYGR